MRINLHIERLILDGVPLDARNRALLQAAVQEELVRLLTEGDASWQYGGAVPSVRADAIRITPQNTPAQLGAEIAGSIYGSIDKAT